MDNVIVTGGSRGLGLGIARKLAATGYNVIAIARSESQELATTMRDVRDAGTGSLHFVPFDLATLSEIPALVKSIRAEFGPIYGVVNNAGLGTSGILSTMPDLEIERLTRLNVLSPIILTKYAIRSMMAKARGRVVNIASIVAFTGYSGLAAYSASKASLVGFTRSLARELGPVGITVNAVAPGFIDTDMTQHMNATDRARLERRSALRHLAGVEDVANAVEFLLDGKAGSITGTVLTVDAGATA
jgi:3-oxoacyl-[acyl-carrier protein] reductase